MNPRHSMKRFLFKEIGWDRFTVYFALAFVVALWGAFYKGALDDIRKPRKTYTLAPTIDPAYAKGYVEGAKSNRRDYPFQIFCTEEQRKRMTALLIEIQETGGRF